MYMNIVIEAKRHNPVTVIRALTTLMSDEAIEAINAMTDDQLDKLARIMDRESAEYTIEDIEDIVLRPDILDILNEDWEEKEPAKTGSFF